MYLLHIPRLSYSPHPPCLAESSSYFQDVTPQLNHHRSCSSLEVLYNSLRISSSAWLHCTKQEWLQREAGNSGVEEPQLTPTLLGWEFWCQKQFLQKVMVLNIFSPQSSFRTCIHQIKLFFSPRYDHRILGHPHHWLENQASVLKQLYH